MMTIKDVVVGIVMAMLFLSLLFSSCNAQSDPPQFRIDEESLELWIHSEHQWLDTLGSMKLSKVVIADTMMVRGTLSYLDWSGKYYKEIVDLQKISWFCPEGDLLYMEFLYFTEEGQIIPWKILEFKPRNIKKV